MVTVDPHDVERKMIAILQILNRSSEPVGARAIARQLPEFGINLTERAVRYHLQLMDERGLTEQVGREGRLITALGRNEVASALVTDKVGFVIARIQSLAFQTTLNTADGTGMVVMNTAFFPREHFRRR